MCFACSLDGICIEILIDTLLMHYEQLVYHVDLQAHLCWEADE